MSNHSYPKIQLSRISSDVLSNPEVATSIAYYNSKTWLHKDKLDKHNESDSVVLKNFTKNNICFYLYQNIFHKRYCLTVLNLSFQQKFSYSYVFY